MTVPDVLFLLPVWFLLKSWLAAHPVGLAGVSRPCWHVLPNRVVIASTFAWPKAVSFTWESLQLFFMHFSITIKRMHIRFCTPVLLHVVVDHPVRLARLPSDLGLKNSPKNFPWGIFHHSGRVTVLSLVEALGSPPVPFPSLLFNVAWGLRPWPPLVLCPLSRPDGSEIDGLIPCFNRFPGERFFSTFSTRYRVKPEQSDLTGFFQKHDYKAKLRLGFCLFLDAV